MSDRILTKSLYFCIHYVHIAVSIHKDIARNDIPNDVCSIGVSAFVVLFGKAEGRHICVNHDLSGGLSITNALLFQNWHHTSTIIASKTYQFISCVGKYQIMKNDFVQQTMNTATI